jgi:hypothetical protein
VYCSCLPLSCCGQCQQVQNVNVIHVHAFINNSQNNTNTWTFNI